MQPKDYQLRLNQGHTDLLQLIVEGYSLRIEPGTRQDIEGDTFTFKVSVWQGDNLITSAEDHAFCEAMAAVYGCTPEVA